MSGRILFVGEVEDAVLLERYCRALGQHGMEVHRRNDFGTAMPSPGADGYDVIVVFANLATEVEISHFAARLKAHLQRLASSRRFAATSHRSPTPQTARDARSKVEDVSGVCELTRIEERIFACLLGEDGGLASEALCKLVWPNQKVLRHTLHVHLSSLRQKLIGTEWSVDYVRGRGYSLRRSDDSTKSVVVGVKKT